MVKIRLARQGRKQLPIYRIVAANSRARRDGRYVEALGQYRPLNETGKVEINEERIMYWLRTGAQPTDTVRSLLSKEGILLKWHLEKKKIPADRASEIFNTWKTARDEKQVSQLSKKEAAVAAKKKAVEDKKAADLKAKADEAAAAIAATEAAAAAELAATEAAAAAELAAAAPAVEETPTAEVAPEAPAAE
ncbi:MAG: 30S ribosomal protein S16 [Candidatus Kapaibacterium sp.]|jgi:small subunit ribosomal protein S16